MIHHPIDIAEMFHVAGITGRTNRVIAVAICWGESRFNDQATLDNTTLEPPGKGIDRGLMQINSFWQPQVTDACAYDPVCNIEAAVDIFRGRSSTWTAWSAYNNGSYKAFLPEAEIAVEAQIRLRQLAKAKESEKAALQKEIDDLKTQLELMRQARLAIEAQLAIVTAERAALEVLKNQFAAELALTKEQLSDRDQQLVTAMSALVAAEFRFEQAKDNFTDLCTEQAIRIFGE